MVPFIVSTSTAPYKQWLTGRVVVLCDMAPIAAPASRGSQWQHRAGGISCGCHCCPEKGLLPPCKQRLTAAVYSKEGYVGDMR